MVAFQLRLLRKAHNGLVINRVHVIRVTILLIDKLLVVIISVVPMLELLPIDIHKHVGNNSLIKVGIRSQLRNRLSFPIKDHQEYIQVTKDRELYDLLEDPLLSLAESDLSLLGVADVSQIYFPAHDYNFCKVT